MTENKNEAVTLNADAPQLPLEVTPEVAAPVEMSEQSRLELVEQDARLEKEQIKQRLRDALKEAAAIDGERVRIDGAIGQAEQRLSIVSGSRGAYNNARADLVARRMLGEAVDIESAPAGNPMDELSAVDLQTGLKALKVQREELSRRWQNVQGAVKKCERDFAQAHAVEWGAKYMAARAVVVDAWIQVRAAETVFNANVQFPSPVFTGMDWDNFCAPACDGSDHMGALKMKGKRVGRATVSGESIRNSHILMNAAQAIKNEFTRREV